MNIQCTATEGADDEHLKFEGHLQEADEGYREADNGEFKEYADDFDAYPTRIL